MDRLNMLQKYMDFANERNLFQDTSARSFGFTPTPFNKNLEALRWAERMMQDEPQQAPNFFDNAPAYKMPEYVQPQRVPMQPMGGGFQPHPMTDGVNNYLATLMKRGR